MKQEPKTTRERAEDLIRLLVPDWRPTPRQVLWAIRIVFVFVLVLGILTLVGRLFDMTLEEFATLAKAVQSILTPIALVVAAGWAIYTFRALGQITRSRAEVQKTEAEIQHLQQEARIGAVVEISITTSQHTRPNDRYAYVSAVVEIENKGSRNTRLVHGGNERPFSVYAVDFEDNGSLKYEFQAAYPVLRSTAPSSTSPSTVVRAGGREKIPFYFRVSTPGVYLLIFRAPISEEEQDIGKMLGLKFPANWVAKKYLVVERPNGDHSP
jgi:hypothetical protein